MRKHTPGPWDLVTRLREGRSNGSNLRWTVRSEHIEAADEIDRLRAVNADLLDVVKASLRACSANKMTAAQMKIAMAMIAGHAAEAIAKAEGSDHAAR